MYAGIVFSSLPHVNNVQDLHSFSLFRSHLGIVIYITQIITRKQTFVFKVDIRILLTGVLRTMVKEH